MVVYGALIDIIFVYIHVYTNVYIHVISILV